MTSWFLLAAGLLLLPPLRARAPQVRTNPRDGRRISLQALRIGAVVATAAGCIMVLGVWPGGLAAAVLAPVAAVVITRLDARSARTIPTPELSLTLDLVAAALRAGQPVAAALTLAAPAAGAPVGDRLTRVGGLLRLGADPTEAWRTVTDDPVLAPVAVAGRRSSDSGIRLASAFEQLAQDLREQLRAAAQARAHRAGVFAMAPLGLCFLPAFVCLGIAPVVVGIAKGVVIGLP